MAQFNLNSISLVVSKETSELFHLMDDFEVDEGESLIKLLKEIDNLSPRLALISLMTFSRHMIIKINNENKNIFIDIEKGNKHIFMEFWISIFHQKEECCEIIIKKFKETTEALMDQIMYEGATINGKNDEAEKWKVMKEIKDMYTIFKLAKEIMDKNELWNYDYE